MRIGELARRTGVNHRLLRYYEEQGLIEAERSPNGYREYGDEVVLQVRQIRALLGAGLNTGAIRSILPCAQGTRPTFDPCPELMATLHRELASIDEHMDNLERARRALSGYLADASGRVEARETEPETERDTADRGRV
ncbi:MerR family transcriptional regulator [Actinomadura rugatobispora]|uniref:MerR family transcriptional regulator n=1 Tax=Actinomadura rugatobispora TaxID=1994 RepID=A0ABW0ZZ29_9ACTN|nr:MerR family transcriptional regulator [Actinomadura rugatobispora]